MKKILILMLSLIVIFCLTTGCTANNTVANDNDEDSHSTKTETTDDEDIEAPSPTPEVELGPLDGYANNTSFEMFSASKTYKVFADLKIEGTFEDAIMAMQDAGMIERTAPYDNNVGGLKADYTMEGETDKYWITINKNKDGIFNYATYYISAFESDNDLTGFHASQEAYDELYSLIDDGTITNLSGIENYFGKGFLQSSYLNSDGSYMYYYAWRNKNAHIYCMVDDNMDLVSYKLGATSLPDVYVDEAPVNTNTDKEETTNSTNTQSDAPVDIDGTDIDLDYLTITIIDGWQKMDIADGVQLYKGNEVLQLGLEGFGLDDDSVKSYIENTVTKYNGEEMLTVNMWGYDFYATQYEVAGTYQTVFATLFNKDGQQLVVKINSSTADMPEDVQSMMSSVIMK